MAALKKLTEAEKARQREEMMKKMEEKNMINSVDDSVKNEMIKKVENVL